MLMFFKCLLQAHNVFNRKRQLIYCCDITQNYLYFEVGLNLNSFEHIQNKKKNYFFLVIALRLIELAIWPLIKLNDTKQFYPRLDMTCMIHVMFLNTYSLIVVPGCGSVLYRKRHHCVSQSRIVYLSMYSIDSGVQKICYRIMALMQMIHVKFKIFHH